MTTSEIRIIDELDNILDQIKEARKSDDTYSENYYWDYFQFARKFAEVLLDRHISVFHWKAIPSTRISKEEEE